MKAMPLREKAMDMLDSLPKDKLKRAIGYLEYLRGDYDAFDVNENIRQALHEAKSIKAGKIKLCHPKQVKQDYPTA